MLRLVGFVWFLAFALSGCASTALTPIANPLALASPQFATIQVAHQATQEQDWESFNACFVQKPDDENFANHLRMISESSSTPESWLLAHYEAHGLTQAHLDTLRALPTGVAKTQALQDAAKRVIDKHAFCEGILQHHFAPKARQGQGMYAGVPTQLSKVSEKTAIVVLSSMGPQEVPRQQILFMRATDDGWKIDPSPRLGEKGITPTSEFVRISIQSDNRSPSGAAR